MKMCESIPCIPGKLEVVERHKLDKQVLAHGQPEHLEILWLAAASIHTGITIIFRIILQTAGIWKRDPHSSFGFHLVFSRPLFLAQTPPRLPIWFGIQQMDPPLFSKRGVLLYPSCGLCVLMHGQGATQNHCLCRQVITDLCYRFRAYQIAGLTLRFCRTVWLFGLHGYPPLRVVIRFLVNTLCLSDESGGASGGYLLVVGRIAMVVCDCLRSL